MVVYSSIGEKLEEIINQAFGVNFTEFLINLIGTIILILIVRFFFWNKVTAFLDAKKKKIKDEYEMKENLTEEATKLKSEAEEVLKEAKTNAQTIMTTATDNAEKEKESIIKNARSEASKIINDSKEVALKEKENIIKEAKDEVVEIASLMASKIIDKEVDPKKYNDMALKELEDK